MQDEVARPNEAECMRMVAWQEHSKPGYVLDELILQHSPSARRQKEEEGVKEREERNRERKKETLRKIKKSNAMKVTLNIQGFGEDVDRILSTRCMQ